MSCIFKKVRNILIFYMCGFVCIRNRIFSFSFLENFCNRSLMDPQVDFCCLDGFMSKIVSYINERHPCFKHEDCLAMAQAVWWSSLKRSGLSSFAMDTYFLTRLWTHAFVILSERWLGNRCSFRCSFRFFPLSARYFFMILATSEETGISRVLRPFPWSRIQGVSLYRISAYRIIPVPLPLNHTIKKALLHHASPFCLYVQAYLTGFWFHQE